MWGEEARAALLELGAGATNGPSERVLAGLAAERDAEGDAEMWGAKAMGGMLCSGAGAIKGSRGLPGVVAAYHRETASVPADAASPQTCGAERLRIQETSGSILSFAPVMEGILHTEQSPASGPAGRRETCLPADQ